MAGLAVAAVEETGLGAAVALTDAALGGAAGAGGAVTEGAAAAGLGRLLAGGVGVAISDKFSTSIGMSSTAADFSASGSAAGELALSGTTNSRACSPKASQVSGW